MKTLLFSTAIFNRNRVQFLYGMNQIILEPYYVSRNKNGKKVLFGKLDNSSEIKMFEYNRMFNIRILSSNKFSPIIPIIAVFN